MAVVPRVISPWASSPTIVGAVPQEESTGLVEEAMMCPVLVILNKVEMTDAAVEDPMSKSTLLLLDAVGLANTDSSANGVVVPSPNRVDPFVRDVWKVRL